MAKMIISLAAAALLSTLALPGAASAADSKRADGLTNKAPQATEFSSRHRRWHRPRVVRRHYRSPRYYRNNYAYAPYPYSQQYYRPYYAPRYYNPGVQFRFGF